MSMPGAGAEYPIAAVSKLTGISCHALRVWERRYGFPVPNRSRSGHRRYGHDQVVILRRLAELSRSGRPIGALIDDLRAGRIAALDEPVASTHLAIDEPAAELIDRLTRGDLAGSDAWFDELARQLDATELAVRVIAPALVDAGERWFRRECDVFHEHAISGYLRRKLAALIEETRPTNGPTAGTIVIGTAQGDRHEGGLLILHLFLERAGWRVVNLGTDLPIVEYQRALAAWRPDALGVSFILSRNINKRFQELSRLRLGRLPIFVGGRSILNYQALARRHDLIPIAAAMPQAADQLRAEFAAWTRAAPDSP